MKRSFLLVAATFLATATFAQLNVQLHYDLGHDIYGRELSERPRVTATVENFTPDRWGSTYFFIDADFGGHVVKSGYGEISRELQFWKTPVAIHVEYNGGLSGTGSYDDAYLIGPAWNWHSKDFTKTFSVQLMYKYLAHPSHHGDCSHSVQLTEVWGLDFARGLLRFSGYCDLWYDRGASGHLILGSEPQFWVNLWRLPRINDAAKWSVGTEVEITKNLLWNADGRNDGFYVIPTIAMKWTF
ncbi:MAG: DUF5020 family protein [Bacteroidaceae bacterium]|nr:DUF5020 family protein [Bacteroidaceae bacterium]